MENIGGKEFDRYGDHGKGIGGDLPGGGAGSWGGDEGLATGAAAARVHAALAGGTAVAGHARGTARMAGNNAGTGWMTMGAIYRLGRDCAKTAQRQEKNRTSDDGQDQVTRCCGPFHNNY
jgi:hypothetical protein